MSHRRIVRWMAVLCGLTTPAMALAVKCDLSPEFLVYVDGIAGFYEDLDVELEVLGLQTPAEPDDDARPGVAITMSRGDDCTEFEIELYRAPDGGPIRTECTCDDC